MAHVGLILWHQFTWLWGGEGQGGANGTGYLITSGPLGNLFIIGGVVTIVRHHNCHTKGCWRLGHRHPDHGRPVCDHHFHQKPTLGRRNRP